MERILKFVNLHANAISDEPKSLERSRSERLRKQCKVEPTLKQWVRYQSREKNRKAAPYQF